MASNFAPTASLLVDEFVSQNQHTQIRLVKGASGSLFHQITYGAPFDIFLSADTVFPKKLIERNVVMHSASYEYAIGQLALVSFKHDVKQAISQVGFLNTVLSGAKVALPNPKLAPYGKASQEFLVNLSSKEIHAQLQTVIKKENLVTGLNVNQSFQFAYNLAVDYAFVAYSQVLFYKLNESIKHRDSTKTLSFHIIPSAMHQRIKQHAVILSRTENMSLAESFMQFVMSLDSQKLIHKHGYMLDVESDGNSV